ncbi:MAG: ABC transporter ATP-binding protein [Planctomycetota bacterium]|jgi:ABC-2 type transport system ATP-binding protein
MTTAPATTTLASVEGLSLHYGERCAVDALHFAVQKGENFGLLGPNGAGKTSTLSCLTGLVDGWSGRIAFAGKDVRPAYEPEARRGIGLVPQDLAVYGELTARENLEFFGRLAGLTGAALTDAANRGLALSGLEERADERVDKFSGGMKRRLNLSVGDVHRPPLLLLDEPTVGVDPQSRNHIFDTLETLAEEGRTLIYTTHYMEEAQRLCDRILIMNEGRSLGCGSHAELAAQSDMPDATLEDVFLHMTGRSLRDS